MDTQTQIERLIELAIVQRGELRKLVGELPQLREHLNAEIERVFEETEPQLRVELEEFVAKQAQERTEAISAELKAKIDSFAKTLNQSAEAKYSALVAERAKNDDLLKQAEQNIAFAAQALPAQVKEIVTAELARFPRAGEIDQLRKEFAEPKGLNPRGKWSPDAAYNKLDLVGYNGDSFVSNIDGNRERPSRSSESWTLNAARGTGGGGGLLSINDALGNPTSDFTIVGAEGNNYVQKTLVAGANITITESPTAITIIGDEGQISLQDGTAAAPSLFFTNDTDTGLYRPAANTLGISVSGTQIAYFDQNGLTVPSAGVVAGGSIHAANGNANNPSLAFQGDQDTGFFRHQPNEIGIALGGTQYATLTSTTFSITPSVTVGGTFRASGGIVGTAVGASSPSTGAFTTLSAATLNTTGNLTLGTGSGAIAEYLNRGTTAQSNLVQWQTAGSANWSLGSGATGTNTNLEFYNHNTASTNLLLNYSTGNVLIGTTTDNSATFAVNRSGTGPASSGSTSTAAIRAVDVSNDLALDIGINSAASPYPGWIQVHGRTNQATNYPLALNPNGGNVLIGTTTDGGQKLQVNGTARISNILTLDSYLTPGATLTFPGALTSAGYYLYAASNFGMTLLGYGSTYDIYIGNRAGSRAISVDANTTNVGIGGDATVSGNVTAQKSSGSDVVLALNQIGVGQWTFKNEATTGNFKLSIGGNDWVTVNRTTGSTTLPGSIAIGNTVQTAAGVASTHKVTISIGGTTYYLLATNV